VTGADSGIGRAVAALFAREGADVAILYLCEHDDARKAAEIVSGEGRRAITIAGDIGDRSFCQRAVAETVEKLGGLDILVNNAGEQHPDKDVADIGEDQLRRTFQTNVFGMFFLTQAARPHLKRGSAIINCTSVVSYKGSSELLDYSSTKGAITAFTRSLSQNLVEDGIRVNGVAPGPIWTPLNPFGGASPEKIESFGEQTPMGRPGQPNEVAPAFLFLACEDSSYMSGQVLHPNGGTIVNG
jgi:NAD(P)-dependent dehydrogenase (short-subunit alcohol dehydrogenase family)